MRCVYPLKKNIELSDSRLVAKSGDFLSPVLFQSTEATEKMLRRDFRSYFFALNIS